MVDEAVMAAMSDTETAPGVLAVLPLAPRPLPAAPTLLVVLDAINQVVTAVQTGTPLR